MGNATLGSTTSPGTTYTMNCTGPVTAWPSGVYLTATEEMYIDQAYVWCGAHDSNHNFTFAVYGSSGAQIGGNSDTHVYGVGYGWNHGNWGQGGLIHVTSGTNMLVGVYCDGWFQTSSNNDAAGYRTKQGTGLNTNWNNGTIDQFGHIGILHTYLNYFKHCAISSVDAGPFAPGQTFNVYGQSFNSGITSITLNGTNCPTFTVLADSQVQVTVPSGATTGTVTVNTWAGSATSSGSVTISSAYVNTGTFASPVWTPASGVFVNTGTFASPTWTSVGGVFVNTGTLNSPTWTPGG